MLPNVKQIINRARWLCNPLQAFGDRPPFPLLILAHLTSRCSCTCTFCYQRSDPLFENQPELMPIPLFQDLLIQASRLPLRPLIHLYGGEPLDHPEFDRAVGSLSRNGFRATLNTNGERLLDRAHLLARGPARMINVSLDGAGELHDRQRGRPGLFHRAVAGMKLLHRLDPRIALNVNCVISPANVGRLCDELVELDHALRGTGCRILSLEHLAFTRHSLVQARAIDVPVLRGELEQIERREFRFDVSSTPALRMEDLERYYGGIEPFEGINCNVPWLSLNLFPDGTVTPGGAMFECTVPVGDLHRDSLTEVWRGSAMRTFRRRIRRSMPEECFRCCHTMHYARVFRCQPGGG